MKKIVLSLLLCMAMICAMLSLTVSAEGGAAVSVGSASGKAGDTVTVNVNLTQNPGVIAMTLNVGFDANQLELVGVNNSGVLNGYNSPSTYGGNSFTLNWEDALSETNNNATGTVATMTFKLKENCDKANISISGQGYDTNVQGVSVSGSSGTITNTAPTTTTTKPTTTTTKPTTTKATTTTTKKTTTTTKASTTQRTTTTSAFTRPYIEDNTYPVDFTVPATEFEPTTEIFSIIETMAEYDPIPTTTQETTTEAVEEEKAPKISNSRLLIIVLFVCFAIIGVGVIISMVHKSNA